MSIVDLAHDHHVLRVPINPCIRTTWLPYAIWTSWIKWGKVSQWEGETTQISERLSVPRSSGGGYAGLSSSSNSRLPIKFHLHLSLLFLNVTLYCEKQLR